MATIELERHGASAAGSLAVLPTANPIRAQLLTAAPGVALQRSAGDLTLTADVTQSDADLLRGFTAATTPVDPSSFVD